MAGSGDYPTNWTRERKTKISFYVLDGVNLANYTHAKGLSMAWRLSTAIAVRVNTLTVMERTCMNGQKAHMNDGRFHRCSRAA